MNQVKAIISKIECSGNLSLVSLDIADETFYSLIINNSEPYITEGREVLMTFKETEVSIAKGFSGGLSIRNRFNASISGIKKGKLLAEVYLDYKGIPLTSIITSASAENLELKTGDQVLGLVKTNEISLMDFIKK